MTGKLATVALTAVVSLAIAHAAQARYAIGDFEDGTAEGWQYDPDPAPLYQDIADNTSYTSVPGSTLRGDDLVAGTADDFMTNTRGRRTLEISMLGQNSAGHIAGGFWTLTLDVMARSDSQRIINALAHADSISFDISWDPYAMNNGAPGNGPDPDGPGPLEGDTFTGYAIANEMAIQTGLPAPGDESIFLQRAFSPNDSVWDDQDSIPSPLEDAQYNDVAGVSRITYNFAANIPVFTWMDQSGDGGFTDVADIAAFIDENKNDLTSLKLYIAMLLEEDPNTVNPLVYVDNILINTPILLGDVNADDNVDVLDIAPFNDVLSHAAPGVEEADANQDGFYDLLDITWFGVYANGDVSTIPEPASLALLGFAGLALLRRRG